MSDEVEVFLTNGQRRRVSPDEMARIAVHPKSLLIYVFVFCMLVLTAAYPAIAPFSLKVKASVQIPAIIFAIVMWYVTFRFLTVLMNGTDTSRVYSAFPSFVAALASEQIGYRIAMFHEVPIPENLTSRLGITYFNFFLCEIVRITIMNFVTNDIIAKRNKTSAHPLNAVANTLGQRPIVQDQRPDASETIRIDKTDLVVGDIRLASAHGNYLDIIHSDGKIFSNMNISDFTKMLPVYFGMQIHRSHWIAFSEVDEITRTGRNMMIICRSGPTVPVARGRQKEFLRLYADWRLRQTGA